MADGTRSVPAALPLRAGCGAGADSPLDNPFGDQSPGVYQPPDMQVSPGQVPYLPPVGPPIVTEPPQSAEPVTLGDLLFADGRKTPSDTRAGAFQKLSFVNTYLPRMGDNGFGWYDAELTSVWGVPFPTKDAPLVITPGIATHWLNGPAGLDIPAQLHDVYTEFRWLPKIGEAFRLDVAVQPGFYSDWDGSTTPRIASWATFQASTTGRRRFNLCSGPRTSIGPILKCCRSQGLSGSRMRTRSIS